MGFSNRSLVALVASLAGVSVALSLNRANIACAQDGSTRPLTRSTPESSTGTASYQAMLDTAVGITVTSAPRPGASARGASSRAIKEKIASLESVHSSANYGTGVIFRAPNLVLTSARLVQGARGIRVSSLLHRGGVSASVLAVDKATGLAVLKTVERLGQPASLPARGVALGDAVVAACGSGGMRPSLNWSHIAAVDRAILAGSNLLTVAQLDGYFARGCEGGPVFDPSGQLVGVILHWPVNLVPASQTPGDVLQIMSHP